MEIGIKKVVVIEDNRDNLELISIVFRKNNYQVICASTGENGVPLVLKEKPFFVIMDIDLPGIDGLEATRQIRASEPNEHVPIIAITSFAMRGDMEKVIAAGCNGYFEKPIDPLSIMGEIHQILGVPCNESTNRR